MLLFVVLLIIDVIIGGIIYATDGHPKVSMRAFWEKMLASAIFVAYGVYAYFTTGGGEYARLIVIALGLGFIGDALLSFDPFIKQNENENRNIIITMVIGAAVFLAGHAVYIVAFVKEIKKYDAFDVKIFFIAWAVIVATALIVKAALRAKLGKLAAPIAVYALGLSAMGALAISLSLQGFTGNLPLQIVMIAAPLLFIVSDSSLGLKFGEPDRFGTQGLRYVTLVTYYAAQMLFAYSIFLIK